MQAAANPFSSALRCDAKMLLFCQSAGALLRMHLHHLNISGQDIMKKAAAQKGAIFFLAAALFAARLPAAQTAAHPVSTLKPGEYRDVFTVADAGAPQLEMHGIDSVRSIHFVLPLTHVVRAAKMHLDYSFSPALLPQFSRLKLMLNGTLFATVQPTPGANGGADSRDAEAEFTIPAELLVHRNTLSIEFSGRSVPACENPANPALWARVHRDSYLQIDGALLPMADDLRQLPAPVLDPAAMRPASVPIVFFTQPSRKAIQAAGIVASYFGMAAEDRPVRFPVKMGVIPSGNAIVIAESASNLPAELNLPAVNGPTLAMRTNPGDPYGKIVIVAGRDADQVVQAAQALATHSNALAGPQATIANPSLPPKRQADDAPRWARTDRRIALGDYASADRLQGDGSEPLLARFRIPPDLFYAPGAHAPLHIGYRYDPALVGPMSSMQVRVNDTLLGSRALAPAQQSSGEKELDLQLPVKEMRPFENTLSFDFALQPALKEVCGDATPLEAKGSILPASFLDLRGGSHYAPMPNLEIFSNAGFPFTRFADLSETTVVLPAEASAQEIETFVTLMGHFGRQTGYPALRVTVAGPEAMRTGAQTDLLVIGAADDQPGFEKLAAALPVTLRGGRLQVRDTQDFRASLRRALWEVGGGSDPIESGAFKLEGAPVAVVEEAESPFAPGGRSVVAIQFADASSFEPFLSRLLDAQQPPGIAGSVAVLHDGRFTSLRLTMGSYHVSDLPWQMRLQWKLVEVPWFIWTALAIFALLLAIWVRQWLVNRARARASMLEY